MRDQRGEQAGVRALHRALERPGLRAAGRGRDEVVDPGRYREICVGFTPGWVGLPEAVASLEKVVGIPDLNARVDDLISEGDKVYARLTVTGTSTGRFFGAPPTGRRYEASMFDYARLEDGRIVERVQQSDTLSQLAQMYGAAAKKAAAVAGAGLLGAALLALRGGRRGRAGRPITGRR